MTPDAKRDSLTGIFLAAALGLSYKALGTPNHVYQGLFAAAIGALAYHRGWLSKPRGSHGWLYVLGNITLLAFFMKLFIGGGLKAPFDWIRIPSLQFQGEGKGFLPPLVPGFQWDKPSIADWQFDLTLLQTVLLLATLLGGVVRFQPFASLTAIFLLLVSTPTLLFIEWTYVVPALLFGCAAFYTQSQSSLITARPAAR